MFDEAKRVLYSRCPILDPTELRIKHSNQGKSTMNKGKTWRIFGCLYHQIKHTGILGAALSMVLIVLMAGCAELDPLGAAVGIGKLVTSVVLDAPNTLSDTKVVEGIKASPEDIFQYLHDNKVEGATPEQIGSVVDAIQYPSFSSELEHVPLHKEEFYSGTGYAYLLFKFGSDHKSIVYGKNDKRMAAHVVDIAGTSIRPSLYVTCDSKYPTLSFFLLGDPCDDEAKRSCALFGIAQSFPEGTSIKDVGLRAKEKFKANFKIVARDEEIKESIEGSPYTYSYSRTILVLTNASVYVRLFGGASNSFQVTKMDFESYKKVFFDHPDVRTEIYLQTKFGSYDELKKAVEDPDNEMIPGFYLLRKLYEAYNRSCKETYSGNYFDKELAGAKAMANQVSLEVYDSALVKHYLMVKRAADEKVETAKEAKKKEAMEF